MKALGTINEIHLAGGLISLSPLSSPVCPPPFFNSKQQNKKKNCSKLLNFLPIILLLIERFLHIRHILNNRSLGCAASQKSIFQLSQTAFPLAASPYVKLQYTSCCRRLSIGSAPQHIAVIRHITLSVHGLENVCFESFWQLWAKHTLALPLNGILIHLQKTNC